MTIDFFIRHKKHKTFILIFDIFFSFLVLINVRFLLYGRAAVCSPILFAKYPR